MATALAMGLEMVADRLVRGDIVEQVFWTDRLGRAADLLRAANEPRRPNG